MRFQSSKHENKDKHAQYEKGFEDLLGNQKLDEKDK
jgi:hypothetical protein